MKITQQVLLTLGATLSLTVAAVLLTNMLTTTAPSGPSIRDLLAPSNSSMQLQSIVHWVFGILFFAIAASVNRVHQPLATAIGCPGIVMMIFGGFMASFVFQSAFGAIAINFVTAVVCLGAIYLICRNDRISKYAPVYGANPNPVGPAQAYAEPQSYPQPAPQTYPQSQPQAANQVGNQSGSLPGQNPANPGQQ